MQGRQHLNSRHSKQKGEKYRRFFAFCSLLADRVVLVEHTKQRPVGNVTAQN